MKLEELIDRLEKAEGPSRELDDAIWHFAVPNVAQKFKDMGDDWNDCAPHYTASIDAALTLVPNEERGADWLPELCAEWHCGKIIWRAMLANEVFDATDYAYHRTPAIALCIAALKARMA